MKQYPFPKNRIYKIGFGAFLFAMLLLARDTLVTSCLLGFNRSQFLMLGLIFAAVVTFLIYNRRNLREIFTDSRIALLAAVTAILLIPMPVKRDWQLMYFSILLCLYFAVFLTYFTSIQEVSRYYLVILSALSVYAVIATYLLRIFPDNGMAVPVFRNSADVEFYNFGLAYVTLTFVKGRNFGIFREPGVYQFFLIVGLYLNTYRANWDRAWKLWTVNCILAATMLTTFATGGVIEMGLLAAVLFFDKGWYKQKRARRIAIVLVLIALLGITVILLQGGDMAIALTGMVTKLFNGADSSTERMDAIVSDVQIFLRHPIFGAKLGEVLHSVENNTTSTMILFAVFGIAGGLLNVAAWVALVWEKPQKIWVNFALLLILFMSFNTANLVADVFFWLFPAMALAERGLPLLKNRKEKKHESAAA